MNLAILVVYMVREENGPLLDLHLRKIRAMTPVSYTIYGGVNRLAPPVRERLSREPELKLIPLPPTKLRMSAEHSFYLEYLISEAMKDDITHVAIMHVDSFPIRSDWVETIEAELTGDCVLATLSRAGFLAQFSACLFFRADFWKECRPRLLLTGADRSAPEYARFELEHPHLDSESGAGFVYRAYVQNKAFVALEGPARSEARGHYGAVFGDLVFHLAGAYRYGLPARVEWTGKKRALLRTCIKVKDAVKGRFPTPIRRRIRWLAQAMADAWERQLHAQARARLLADPDRCLEQARAMATDGGSRIRIVESREPEAQVNITSPPAAIS